jgi:hypothetical protein
MREGSLRRRVLALVGVSACLLVAGAARAQETLTIEKILSTPFPTGLTSSPTGAKVAWVFNDRGVRNIRVAEPPDHRGRTVTSYTEDSGQGISNLAWAPDGRAIVYVRGGDPNQAGEYPNPTSEPAGVKQAVWVVESHSPTPAASSPFPHRSERSCAQCSPNSLLVGNLTD